LQETSVSADLILLQALQANVFVWVHTHGVRIAGSMTDTLKQLRESGVKTVAYHLDLYMGLERWREYATDPYLNGLEYFFTVDKHMSDWLNQNTDTKGFYLPAGVFDKECSMLDAQRVKYDIIFTGSKKYHKEHSFRPQLIDFLRTVYGRRFIHIGNDGEIGPQRGLRLNQIYRNAKVVVGDTLQINFDYPYYFSDRLFEVPGRGGFSIFPGIQGVEDYYEPNKEIVLYKHGDLNDLKQKIDYYLTHHDERETIRLSGFDRTKRDHTYINRWRTILETVYDK